MSGGGVERTVEQQIDDSVDQAIQAITSPLGPLEKAPLQLLQEVIQEEFDPERKTALVQKILDSILIRLCDLVRQPQFIFDGFLLLKLLAEESNAAQFEGVWKRHLGDFYGWAKSQERQRSWRWPVVALGMSETLMTRFPSLKAEIFGHDGLIDALCKELRAAPEVKYQLLLLFRQLPDKRRVAIVKRMKKALPYMNAYMRISDEVPIGLLGLAAPELSHCLKDTSDIIQKWAVVSIACLFSEDEKITQAATWDLFRDTELLNNLTALLLTTENTLIQVRGAGIIQNLGRVAECIPLIAESEAIPVLLKLFVAEDPEVRDRALAALFNFYDSPECLARMMEASAVPLLFLFLSSEAEARRNRDAWQSGALLLAYFFPHLSVAVKIAALPYLLDLLQSNPSFQRQIDCQQLSQLLKNLPSALATDHSRVRDSILTCLQADSALIAELRESLSSEGFKNHLSGLVKLEKLIETKGKVSNIDSGLAAAFRAYVLRQTESEESRTWILEVRALARIFIIAEADDVVSLGEWTVLFKKAIDRNIAFFPVSEMIHWSPFLEEEAPSEMRALVNKNLLILGKGAAGTKKEPEPVEKRAGSGAKDTEAKVETAAKVSPEIQAKRERARAAAEQEKERAAARAVAAHERDRERAAVEQAAKAAAQAEEEKRHQDFAQWIEQLKPKLQTFNEALSKQLEGLPDQPKSLKKAVAAVQAVLRDTRLLAERPLAEIVVGIDGKTRQSSWESRREYIEQLRAKSQTAKKALKEEMEKWGIVPVAVSAPESEASSVSERSASPVAAPLPAPATPVRAPVPIVSVSPIPAPIPIAVPVEPVAAVLEAKQPGDDAVTRVPVMLARPALLFGGGGGGSAVLAVEEILAEVKRASLEEYYNGPHYRAYAAAMRSLGFDIQEVPSDGNCFYQALYEQLRTTVPDRLEPHINESNANAFLRGKARVQLASLIEGCTDPFRRQRLHQAWDRADTDHAFAEDEIIEALAATLRVGIVVIRNASAAEGRGGERNWTFVNSGKNLPVIYIGHPQAHFEVLTGEPTSEALRAWVLAKNRPALAEGSSTVVSTLRATAHPWSPPGQDSVYN